MKKSELRKLMNKENTIAKARKIACETRKRINEDEMNVYVRCFSSCEDGVICTSLDIDIQGYEWETISIASIEIDENEMDFWEFVDMTRDIFKAMKSNLLKELNTYAFNNINTEDYVL